MSNYIRQRSFYFLLSLLYSYSFWTALALAVDADTKPNTSKLVSVNVADTKKEKTLQVSMQANHYFAMQNDINPETAVELGTSYLISDVHRLGLTFAAVKYYEITKGEEEWLLADPTVAYRYTIIAQDAWGLASIGPSIAIAPSLSIPVSESSRINDLITRFGLSLPIGYEAKAQKLNFNLNPRLLYYFNRYKTTPTEIGDNGGQPLRKTDLSMAATISWQALNFLSFDVMGRYGQIRYESIELANSVNSGEILPVQHIYAFDLSMAATLEKQAKVRIGYTKEDPAEQNGGVKILAYDELSSRIYAGVELTF